MASIIKVLLLVLLLSPVACAPGTVGGNTPLGDPTPPVPPTSQNDNISLQPPPGEYSSPQVVIANNSYPGTSLHYTTDGSFATDAAKVYSDPLNISTTTVLNFSASVKGSSSLDVNLSNTKWKCVNANGGASNGITCQAGGGVGVNQPSAWSWTWGDTMVESLSTTASSSETQQLYIYSGPACDTCTTISQDKWIKPSQGRTYIANAEMDMYQFDSTHGIQHMFGLQCNQQSGIMQWQIDNNGKWVNTGITDNCPLPTTQYTHVVYTGHWIIGDKNCGTYGCNYYDDLIINGVAHHLGNYLAASALPAGWGSVCGLQDQIDLTNTTVSGENPTTAAFNIKNASVACGFGPIGTTKATYTIP